VYSGFEDDETRDDQYRTVPAAPPVERESGEIVYSTMADTLDAADMATPYATVSPDEVRDKFKELADDFRKDVLHRREAAAAATQMSSSASSPGIPRPVLETEGGAAESESGELVVTDAAGRPLSPIGTVKAGGFMNISKGSFYKTIDRKSRSKAGRTRSAELGGPTEPDSPTLGESGFGFSTPLDDGWQTDSGLAVSEIDFTGDFDSSSDADTHGATEVHLAADENSAYNWFGAAPAHTGTHGATEVDLTADVYSSFRTTVNSSWLYVLALPREEFPDCVSVTGGMLIPTPHPIAATRKRHRQRLQATNHRMQWLMDSTRGWPQRPGWGHSAAYPQHYHRVTTSRLRPEHPSREHRPP
jgi:hypothetical protein